MADIEKIPGSRGPQGHGVRAGQACSGDPSGWFMAAVFYFGLEMLSCESTELLEGGMFPRSARAGMKVSLCKIHLRTSRNCGS